VASFKASTTKVKVAQLNPLFLGQPLGTLHVCGQLGG
jgi:hypothetical protein